MTNEQRIAELRQRIAASERAIVKLQIEILFQEDPIRKATQIKLKSNILVGLEKDKLELDSLL